MMQLIYSSWLTKVRYIEDFTCFFLHAIPFGYSILVFGCQFLISHAQMKKCTISRETAETVGISKEDR